MRFRTSIAIVLICSAAGATEPGKEALAQSLFDEGRKLYTAGSYEQACAKFSASNELDPKGGTLLNLAMCHEKLGLLASAWAEFAVARDRSTKEKRPDRVEFAEQRIAALAPLISRVRIAVRPEIGAGLEVRLDKTIVPRAAWGDPMPVDPGKHELSASSPDGTFDKPFEVGDQAQTIELAVDRLEPRPVPPPPAPRTGRTIALVSLGVVAAAGVGFGAGFGAVALDKRHEAENLCRAGDCIAGNRANDSGVTAAWVSNISFGVAIASAVVLTIVFFATNKSPKTTAMLTF